MKVFSMSLLTAALLGSLTEAKKGKMFGANAFVTPKRENKEEADPYLKQNLLNLRQTDEFGQQINSMSLSKVAENIKHTLLADPDTVAENHIVATSDIDNYFNLQITAQLYFGSEQEPHDLILDTGSMVSSPD